MKTIKLPSPSGNLTFRKIWTDIIYPRDTFRRRVEATRAGIAIDEKSETQTELLTLTDQEHEILLQGMQLLDQLVGPHDVLRYFMRCLDAVQSAETPKDPP